MKLPDDLKFTIEDFYGRGLDLIDTPEGLNHVIRVVNNILEEKFALPPKPKATPTPSDGKRIREWIEK